MSQLVDMNHSVQQDRRPSIRIDGTRTIADVRRDLGMTQDEFAHALGVSEGTVNRWENRRNFPSRLARKAIMALVPASSDRAA